MLLIWCGTIFAGDMLLLALVGPLGGPELIIILLLVLVLFGAKKLPELARGMGQAIKEFQKAKDEFSDELHSSGKDVATKAEASRPSATVPRIENVSEDARIAADLKEPASKAGQI